MNKVMVQESMYHGNSQHITTFEALELTKLY